MIVEELVVEWVFREDFFPGRLNKGEGLFSLTAVDLHRHGYPPPPRLNHHEHRLNLVVEGIKIEVFADPDDTAQGVASEMFANQRDKCFFSAVFTYSLPNI